MRQQAIDFAVYLFVRLFIAVVQAVPLAVCERGAELLATVFGRVLRVRATTVEENLSIAFPNLTAAGARRLRGECGGTCSS